MYNNNNINNNNNSYNDDYDENDDDSKGTSQLPTHQELTILFCMRRNAPFAPFPFSIYDIRSELI
jgi:hypothetical protein